MKKIIASTLMLTFSLISKGQNQPYIPPIPENMAAVYFVRTSGLGGAINFTYFDSAVAIGRTNGVNYIRYVCEPGRHLFWARSENRDFVEADLEAGKNYFIVARPRMGAIKTSLKLEPVDPKDINATKKILSLLSKQQPERFTREVLEKETERLKNVIDRGLEEYLAEKKRGMKHPTLEKSQYYRK